jgi:hypothetical protein
MIFSADAACPLSISSVVRYQLDIAEAAVSMRRTRCDLRELDFTVAAACTGAGELAELDQRLRAHRPTTK